MGNAEYMGEALEKKRARRSAREEGRSS